MKFNNIDVRQNNVHFASVPMFEFDPKRPTDNKSNSWTNTGVTPLIMTI